MEYPESQTGIFGRVKSGLLFTVTQTKPRNIGHTNPQQHNDQTVSPLFQRLRWQMFLDTSAFAASENRNKNN